LYYVNVKLGSRTIKEYRLWVLEKWLFLENVGRKSEKETGV